LSNPVEINPAGFVRHLEGISNNERVQVVQGKVEQALKKNGESNWTLEGEM